MGWLTASVISIITAVATKIPETGAAAEERAKKEMAEAVPVATLGMRRPKKHPTLAIRGCVSANLALVVSATWVINNLLKVV
jgi:hypothetical protein